MPRKQKSEHYDDEFDSGIRRKYEPVDRWIVFQAPFANQSGQKLWAAKPRKIGVFISLTPLVAIATFNTLVEAGDFARGASTGKVALR